MSARYLGSLIFGLLLNIALPNSTLGYTGNEFLEDCKNNDSLRQHCASYFGGMVSATNTFVYREAGYEWCIPPEVKASQHLDLLISFLEENPKERHRTVLAHLVGTLRAEWPCD